MNRLHNSLLCLFVFLLVDHTAYAQTRILGRNFEQTVSTSSSSLSPLGISSLPLESGQAHTFTYPANPAGSFYFWSVSEGNLEEVSGFPDYSKVTYTAPVVTQTTDVSLFTVVGDGLGHALDQIVSITVSPAGGSNETISITSNSSGSSWEKGTSQTVSWSGNLTGDVSIALFRNGTRVRTLAVVPFSLNSYAVTVPTDLPTGSGYEVRVLSTSSNTISAVSATFSIDPVSTTTITGVDLIVEDFTIEPASVKLGEPVHYRCVIRNRGTVAANRPFRVEFHRSLDDQYDPNEDVEMGGGGFINSLLPGGSAIIDVTHPDVPDHTPAGNHRILAVADVDSQIFESEEGNNTQSAYLTVEVDESMNVLTPPSAASFQVGGALTTTWSSNVGGNVRIELMKSLSVERLMVGSTSNDGSYTWTIPSGLTIPPSNHSNYSVRITSLSDGSAVDSSEQFSILEASEILISLPVSGNQLQIGDSYNVNWYDDYDGSFRLDLYRYGSFIKTIAASVPSPGNGTVQYDWVPGTELEAGDGYEIRFTFLEDSSISATGGPFSLLPSNNHAPRAVDDVVATDANVSVLIAPLINDSDHDDDPFDISVFSQASYGEVTHDEAAKTFTYSPIPNFTGEDYFEYEISDGQGSATARVTIGVNPSSEFTDYAIQRGGGSDDDWVYDLVVSDDGSTYVTGSFVGQSTFGKGDSAQVIGNASSRDFFLAKYDSDWNLLWIRHGTTPSGANYSSGNSVSVDSSGDVYLAGLFAGSFSISAPGGNSNFVSRGETDLFLAKFSAAGNFVWARQHGGPHTDYPRGVEASSNAVYLVGTFTDNATIGTTNVTSVGNSDGFLLKVSTAGSPMWLKTGGSTSGDQIYGIGIDEDDNAYVIGDTIGDLQFDGSLISTSNRWLYLLRYAPSGNQLLATKIADFENGNTYGYDVETAADGSTYLIGDTSGEIVFSPDDESRTIRPPSSIEGYLAKIESTGKVSWAHLIGGSGRQFGYGISVGPGGVLATGLFEGECRLGPQNSPYAVLESDKSGASWLAQLTHDGDFVDARMIEGISSASRVISKRVAWKGESKAVVGGRFSEEIVVGQGAGRSTALSSGNHDIFLGEFPVSEHTTQNKPPEVTDDSSLTNVGVPVFVDVRSNDHDPEGHPLIISHIESPSVGTVEIDNDQILYTPSETDPGLVQFDYTVTDGQLFTSARVSILVREAPNTQLEVISAASQNGTETIETRDIFSDDNGNVFVCGSFRGTANFGNSVTRTSTGDNDGFIAKYSDNGDVVWVTTIRGTGSQYAQRMELGTDGHVYLGGRLHPDHASTIGEGVTQQSLSAGFCGFISSFTQAGQIRWISPVQVTATNPHYSPWFFCRSLGLGPNNEVNVSGWAAGDVRVGAVSNDLPVGGVSYDQGIVIKTLSTGQPQWIRRVASGRSYYGAIGQNGDFYQAVEGRIAITVGGQFFDKEDMIVKYNSSGVIEWAIAIKCQGMVFRDSDSSLIVSTPTGLVSLSPTDGSTNWTKTLPIVPEVKATDASGNIYGLAHLTQSGIPVSLGDVEISLSTLGGYDILPMILDPGGEFITVNQLGSNGDDYHRGFELLPSGDILISGTYSGPLGLGENLSPLTWLGASDGLWVKARLSIPEIPTPKLDLITRRLSSLEYTVIAEGTREPWLLIEGSNDGVLWWREQLLESYNGLHTFSVDGLQYDFARHLRFSTPNLSEEVPILATADETADGKLSLTLRGTVGSPHFSMEAGGAGIATGTASFTNPIGEFTSSTNSPQTAIDFLLDANQNGEETGVIPFLHGTLNRRLDGVVTESASFELQEFGNGGGRLYLRDDGFFEFWNVEPGTEVALDGAAVGTIAGLSDNDFEAVFKPGIYSGSHAGLDFVLTIEANEENSVPTLLSRDVSLSGTGVSNSVVISATWFDLDGDSISNTKARFRRGNEPWTELALDSVAQTSPTTFESSVALSAGGEYSFEFQSSDSDAGNGEEKDTTEWQGTTSITIDPFELYMTGLYPGPVDPSLLLPENDNDQDGWSNYDEFLMGSLANDPNSGFNLQIINVNGSLVRFEYNRVRSTGTYYLKRSTNMSDWSTVDAVTPTSDTDGFQFDYNEGTLPPGAQFGVEFVPAE